MITQSMAGKLLKASYSAAMAGMGSVGVVLNGPETFGQITDGQWVTIAGLTLGAFGGTYGLAGWSGPSSLDGNGEK